MISPKKSSFNTMAKIEEDPIQKLIVEKCIVKNIDVSIDDIIKMFPKEKDGNYHSIPVNHHKLTDTSNEYDDLKTHVNSRLNASMNLSCITFHAVPYTRILDTDEIENTSEALFDLIDMKSHNSVPGKGKMVSLQLNDEQPPDIGSYRIGLVEGLHRSHIFHQICDAIASNKIKADKMFKLTLYFKNQDCVISETELKLFTSLSYNLSVEIRSGNEHSLFDAMHRSVSHIISQGKYTSYKPNGEVMTDYFEALPDAPLSSLTGSDKNDFNKTAKAAAQKRYDACNSEKIEVEEEFVNIFYGMLKQNKQVNEICLTHTASKTFRPIELVSEKIPTVATDQLIALVTQTLKNNSKGKAISMRAVTSGGCPAAMYFLISILLSTVLHKDFATRLRKGLFSMNDTPGEQVTYQRLQSVFIYASVLMKKMYDNIPSKDYTHKLRVKSALFSNFVYLILGVYECTEDDFNDYLGPDDNNSDPIMKEACADRCITNEIIQASQIKIFPMMVNNGKEWVVSADIPISRRDRFVWWWVEYISTSMENADKLKAFLTSVQVCAFFNKKKPLPFTNKSQVFFPPSVQNESDETILLLDALAIIKENQDGALFKDFVRLSIQKNQNDSDDDDNNSTSSQNKTGGQALELRLEAQSLQSLIICAAHTFIRIPKKDFSYRHDYNGVTQPLIDTFFDLVINSSLLISSKDNSGKKEIKHFNRRIEALKEQATVIVKEQSKVPRYKTYNALESVTQIQKITNKLPEALQLKVFKKDFSIKDQKTLKALKDWKKRTTRSITKNKTSDSDSEENSESLKKRRKVDGDDDFGEKSSNSDSATSSASTSVAKKQKIDGDNGGDDLSEISDDGNENNDD